MRKFGIIVLITAFVIGAAFLVRSCSARKSAPAGVTARAARVAVVLDDFGYTRKNLEALKSLGVPVTLAVLPNTPYSREVSDFAGANGMEVILHLPMEPESATESLEKDTIKVSMSSGEVKSIIDRAMEQVPSARGVSNHMGSKATRDEGVMNTVALCLKKKGMYFLDSMTTGASVSSGACREAGVPFARRDIFLDHEGGEEQIILQLDKVERMALASQDVVAIGHDKSVTVKVLKERLPAMKRKGVRFVRLSEMVRSGKE